MIVGAVDADGVQVTAMMLVAISTSVLGATLMKASQGLRRPLPVVGMAASYSLGLALLTLLATRMPIGTVYAVWAGGATLATALISRWFLAEVVTWRQWFGILLIAFGVVLVNA